MAPFAPGFAVRRVHGYFDDVAVQAIAFGAGVAIRIFRSCDAACVVNVPAMFAGRENRERFGIADHNRVTRVCEFAAPDSVIVPLRTKLPGLRALVSR